VDQEFPLETLADPLARPCIQCRQPVTFDGQPGDGVCEACGVRQYLTGPGKNWPDGGQGRYWVPGYGRRPG